MVKKGNKKRTRSNGSHIRLSHYGNICLLHKISALHFSFWVRHFSAETQKPTYTRNEQRAVINGNNCDSPKVTPLTLAIASRGVFHVDLIALKCRLCNGIAVAKRCVVFLHGVHSFGEAKPKSFSS